MRKRQQQDEEREKRRKQLYVRNWILCIVSLGLAILCYYVLGAK